MRKLTLSVLALNSVLIFSQEKKVIDTAAATKEIQAVTLEGKKKLIERKVDRTVFNVENSVAVQGGDAMDALRVTPGVKISSDDIKLTGKSTVKVMVNDKIVQLSGEELQNYLKSIPTANILKIEVITNPPAKYEAEGNSGLINIQLKEAKQDNWSATARSAYEQGFYAQFTEGLGFNYRKNKLAVLADVNYKFGDWVYTNDIHYYYPNELWSQNIFKKTNRKSLGTLLNISYDLTEKTTVGAQFSGAFTKRASGDFNDNFSYSYADNTVSKYYRTDGEEAKKPEVLSVNLNLAHKLDDKGKKYTVDADYFESALPQSNMLVSTMNNYLLNSADRQRAENNSSQKITNYSAKTDFELPYEWAELSFGAKISTTKTTSLVDTKFFQIPTDAVLSARNDNFEYTENNEALYISATKSFGKKWEAKAGLRGENTQTKANSISTNQQNNRDYFKLFPTAYLSFKPNDDHTISVNYGRRIERPAYWQLNPARNYSSPTQYTTGNPFLQPTFNDMVELNYLYKSLLSLNLYAYKSKDDISQMSFHDPATETVVMRHENFANSRGSGGTLTINYNPFRWWESSTDFSIYYNETNPILNLFAQKKYSGWGGGTTTNNTFTLNKKKTFFASLNYWYSFPSISWGTISQSSSLGIGFKYLALNKKLTVGLNFEDIFKSQPIIYTSFTQGIKQTFHQYYDSRNVRLSLSYKFGNGKISVNQHEGGNREEKNRAN